MAVKFILGVSGGSGSGKTTFINRIKEQFDEHDLCVISQDDYYRPREEQEEDAKGVKNFDLPQSIDHVALLEDLRRLKNGYAVTRQEYTFNNDQKQPEEKHFYPAKILVVEGLFIYYFEEIKALLDLQILIDAKLSSKIIRRIKRDRVERNYPLDDVLYRYENHVMPAYEKYIHPFKDDVDVVINNNDSFEKGLKVVEGYIKYLISTYE
jgi:uridine kinase